LDLLESQLKEGERQEVGWLQAHREEAVVAKVAQLAH
jgi:hypothetical protein